MMLRAVYGNPPFELAAPAADAIQLSPFIPQAPAIESLAGSSLSRITLQAPPGTLERRFVIAHALRALADGGELVVLALKDKGGSRLRHELEAFGCEVRETARRHHRICVCRRPAAPAGLDGAIAAGALQIAPRLDLWSQPGVFSWDRLDPGTALLLENLPLFTGRGGDLGCGLGMLAAAAMQSPAVSVVTLIDNDRRAVEAARRNVGDPRAVFVHGDIRSPGLLLDLDFVVMNPPFHDGGREDRELGLAFIVHAGQMLRPGGVCRLVANVALAYEARLKACFARSTLVAQARGYKIYECIK